MFRRYALVLAITLFIAHAASGQTVARAYADNDGKAHVAFANGVDKIIKPQPEQVGCADVSVADDGRTVGWSVLVHNCCTSYPISTSIVVYKDGHQHVITARQMIWKWRFIEGGSQIAVLSGPVHGEHQRLVYTIGTESSWHHGMAAISLPIGRRIGNRSFSLRWRNSAS
jgi:hypothetical protein